MPELRKRIGFFLCDGVEELDAVGPWEVLAHWTLEYPEDGWTVVLFSADGAAVRGAKGMVLGAQCSVADLPTLDVLVDPGGRGTRALMRDRAHLAWLARQRQHIPLMTSVCTGALVYAAAGLLRGRPATTYWDCFDELAAADPSIELRRTERFVDDGDIVTSAGVSAGIDMALGLVERHAGSAREQQVRRGIQDDADIAPRRGSPGC